MWNRKQISDSHWQRKYNVLHFLPSKVLRIKYKQMVRRHGIHNFSIIFKKKYIYINDIKYIVGGCHKGGARSLNLKNEGTLHASTFRVQ